MSSLEIRRTHIEAWQSSGMSPAAYCRGTGLNSKTFGNWVHKHRADQVIGTAALVPVTLKPMPAPANTLQSTVLRAFSWYYCTTKPAKSGINIGVQLYFLAQNCNPKRRQSTPAINHAHCDEVSSIPPVSERPQTNRP